MNTCALEAMYWDHARGWRARCTAGDWTGDPAGYLSYGGAVDAHAEHVRLGSGRPRR